MFKPMTEAEYRRMWQKLRNDILLADMRHGMPTGTIAYSEELDEALIKHNIKFYRAIGLIVDEEPVAEGAAAE